MKNGCPECEKLPGDKMCDRCELGMLQCTAEAAVHDYIDKVNKILLKESETKLELGVKENEDSRT